VSHTNVIEYTCTCTENAIVCIMCGQTDHGCLFSVSDVQRLFSSKFVCVIGDSGELTSLIDFDNVLTAT